MRQATSLTTSLGHSAGGRLFGVFWGSLVVIDLAGLTHVSPAVAMGAVVLVVALGSWRQAVPTVLAAAVMGWMFVNGFLVNRLGQLGWDGLPDLWRLLLLTAVALAAGRAGRLDGFPKRSHGRSHPRPEPSHAAPGHPAQAVEREKHAVGR